MAKKYMQWRPKGMNRDLSVSVFSPEFVFENKNLRLSTFDNNTQMSWVNEKGTGLVTLYDTDNKVFTIKGHVIGTAVINSQLVLFVHSDKDFIYKLTYRNTTQTEMTVESLYEGYLNFNEDYPLETLVSYEADNIQKVYWTDGLNQPRVINIKKEGGYQGNKSNEDYNPFDFVPQQSLDETISVQKIVGGGGSFQPGVIQYCFTYYNKNSQESSIFYTTPLYYISYKDRGASPETTTVENVFKITLKHLDLHFDYVRIYSLQRTSIDSTPLAKRVQDLSLDNIRKQVEAIQNDTTTDYTDTERAEALEKVWQLSFTDTGRMGGSIDPTELLYKNGETITAGTFEQKDNTLFLGHLTVVREVDENKIDAEAIKNNITITTDHRKIYCSNSQSSDYTYANQLTAYSDKDLTQSTSCGGFKRGENYRLGVQFQYKTGKWSDVVWIGDKDQDQYPSFLLTMGSNSTSTVSTQDTSVETTAEEITTQDSTEETIEETTDDASLSRSFTLSGSVSTETSGAELPVFKGALSEATAKELQNKGYLRIRPVVVFPNIYDRKILCQGVTCPTLYTKTHRETNKDLYAQPSWFFRTWNNNSSNTVSDKGTVAPITTGTHNTAGTGLLYLVYTNTATGDSEHAVSDWMNANIRNIRQVEIQGQYNDNNKFIFDPQFVTFHSPDVYHQELFNLTEFNNTKYQQTGSVVVAKTFSDINIQTETPTISSSGSGFIHNAFVDDYTYGIVSGPFYEDYSVDDTDQTTNKVFEAYPKQNSTFKWMVYLWNRSGSLNNDINRPTNAGVQSAKLKEKVISNLRICNTHYYDGSDSQKIESHSFIAKPQLFMSDSTTLLKFDSNLYMGNIDTLLIPDSYEGLYFSFSNATDELLTNRDVTQADADGTFNGKIYWKTYGTRARNGEDGAFKDHGIWHYGQDETRTTDPDTLMTTTTLTGENHWYLADSNLGTSYNGIVANKDSVRMRYNSSPHLVFLVGSKTLEANTELINDTERPYSIPIVEILNTTEDSTRFGGTTQDALKDNLWIPCGEPVKLDNIEQDSKGNKVVNFEYSYGDTYYQRWDCLKTYPAERDDLNQVVEIGSFMLESHINLDGRYDRNRGQINNLNMSPENFNLLNYVYTQTNNFFNYRVFDEEEETKGNYPNQITWSLSKTNGADTDLWTNITLASILETDGDKGEIRKIIRFNDQLLIFQDKGISQLLYNENVQISSQQGVPIEIANSGKVQGTRYLSNDIGCSNKWSIVRTPAGIYFMDSLNKAIYLFNGQLGNLSVKLGFDSWCKQQIPIKEKAWTPVKFENFVSYYDKLNQDVLFINQQDALAYSENFGQFTSFYSYENTPYFINFDDTGLWIKEGDSDSILYRHQNGSYCQFFGHYKDYSMTFVANSEPQADKIFTNLEYRASVDGEGSTEENRYLFTLPFDYLEVWDEYQHGEMILSQEKGIKDFLHHQGEDEVLKRKFRIWRCDIPRSNAELSQDTGKNIFRTTKKPMERMRNPWLYLHLKKAENPQNRMELHDITLTYYV